VAAEQPDEGLRLCKTGRSRERGILSPVAGACPRAGRRPDLGGDTLSHRSRVFPTSAPPDAQLVHSRVEGERGLAALPDAAHRIEIVVAPGVSAMQAAAARAGAPLGHDFCAISLSDLLTPWETIEARIRAAAEGDFVIAFYNPVSQRRTTQLEEAKRILLQHRAADTPVMLARNLGREGETMRIVTLSDLGAEMVDMLTLVLVGSSATRQVVLGGRAWIYTPRGYERKRNESQSFSLCETAGEAFSASAPEHPSSALRQSRRAPSPTRGEG